MEDECSLSFNMWYSTLVSSKRKQYYSQMFDGKKNCVRSAEQLPHVALSVIGEAMLHFIKIKLYQPASNLNNVAHSTVDERIMHNR